LSEVNTGYGEPFPARARQEILRLAERLSLVERLIAEIEAERDALVREGPALSASLAPEDSQARATFRNATLTRLKGIGANDATGHCAVSVPFPAGMEISRAGIFFPETRMVASRSGTDVTQSGVGNGHPYERTECRKTIRRIGR